MKLDESIKQLLQQHGKAVIPNLGTFVAVPSSASMSSDGQVMAPPSLQVSFEEEASDVAEESIAKWVLAQGTMSADDLRHELEAFVKGVKNSVSLHGSCELRGLGKFVRGEEGNLDFVQNRDEILGADSFGLPRIEPRPLTPAVATPPPPVTPANGMMLKALAIPLALLFFIFLYLLFNRPAYEKLASYFEPNSGQVTPRPSEGSGLAGEQPGGSDAQAGGEGQEGTSSTQNKPEGTANTPKNEPAPKPAETAKPKPAETTKPAAESTASTDMVVSSPTKRFYVVVGSYADVAGAKKAALKYRGIGYAQAKVVQGGGRIRVSLNDFAQKADASALAAKAGKDFPGAWVFAY